MNDKLFNVEKKIIALKDEYTRQIEINKEEINKFMEITEQNRKSNAEVKIDINTINEIIESIY